MLMKLLKRLTALVAGGLMVLGLSSGGAVA